jgi:polyisoprenoid-binding protein YceI
MLRKTVILFFTLAVFAFKASAPEIIYFVSNGSISFSADAREIIKATSNELKGVIDIAKKQFAFKVRVASFNGFNSPLQKEHFNENYLETNTFPYASFEGKIIEDVDLSISGTYNVRAKGNLIIHGVSQERIIRSDLIVKNSNVTLLADFTVLLADHGITIPKLVHEKLASEIKVEVRSTLVSK